MANFTTQFHPECRAATMSHSYWARSTEAFAGGVGQNIIIEPVGLAYFLQGMMGPRFDYPHMVNGRHAGQNMSTMLANLDAHLAECKLNKINHVFFIGVCNDSINTLATSSAFMTKLATMAAAYTNAGIRFTPTSDIGVGGAFTRSAATLAGLGRIQDFCLNQLPRVSKLIYPVNFYDQLIAYDNTDGAPAGSFTNFYSSDLLHPNTRGHYLMCKAIYDQVLNDLYPVGRSDYPTLTNAFQQDLSLNVTGNILNNGMFLGDTAGVSTSWTSSSAPTGVTVTPSKVVSGNGTYQKIVYSGTPTGAGATHALRQDPTVTKFAAGDKVRGSVYVLVKKSDAATGWANLRGIDVQLSISDTDNVSDNFSGQMGYSVELGQILPTDVDMSQFNDGKGWYFRTPENEITSIWTAGRFVRWTQNVVLDAASVACDVEVQYRQAKVTKTHSNTNYDY